MNASERRRSPALSITLGIALLGSMIGIAYSILVLSGTQTCPLSTCRMVYYAAYFVVSAASVIAVLRWKRWGVYSIVTATSTVAVADYVQQAASLQDFISIMVLLAGGTALISKAWAQME
jgi:hypothetical protein